jgi:galactonate dehydratase
MFHDVAWRDEVIDHPLDVRDGKLLLSERPGLGVDLVESVMEAQPGIRELGTKENFYV